MARADQEVLLAREQEHQRERPAQPGQRRPDGLDGRTPVPQGLRDEVGHDLRVGLGLERDPVGLQLGLQLAVVLDDAVVDDREPVGGVRMGVGLVRLAVRRPARVADADRAGQRRLRQLELEVAQLAFGAPALEAPVLQGGDARRVVAAVLEALQRVDDLHRHRLVSEDADDSAHGLFPAWTRVRPLRSQNRGRVNANDQTWYTGGRFASPAAGERGSAAPAAPCGGAPSTVGPDMVAQAGPARDRGHGRFDPA